VVAPRRDPDWELIESTFDQILEKHGREFEASELRAEEQTVVLVVTAKGIIDNGGFQYLFEGCFAGDPGYELTAAAFERIGALGCVLAFKRAFGLFPGHVPPEAIKTRMDVFGRVPEPRRSGIDELFFDRTHDVWRLLARYIRIHASAFEK
jgi:hypothetical protein